MERLDLAWQGRERARTLAKSGLGPSSAHAATLRELRIAGSDDLDYLATLQLPALRRLCVTGCELDESPERELLRTVLRAHPKLETLEFVNSWCTDSLQLGAFTGLRHLVLRACELGLCEGLSLPPALESLRVSAIEDTGGLAPLLELASQGPLTKLGLEGTVLGPEHLTPLAQLPLARLSLDNALLDEELIERLLGSPLLDAPMQLSFRGCAMSDAARDKLGGLECRARLEGLDARSPERARWLGRYAYDHGGSSGGESSLLVIERGPLGDLRFRYDWSGWWSSGYDADGDLYWMEGRVDVEDAHAGRLLLPTSSAGGHLDGYNGISYISAYLVSTDEGRFMLLHDWPEAPHGEYVGPFELELTRE